MKTLDELTQYAYGLMDPAEEAQMKAHLDSCASCVAMLDRVRSERRLFERAAEREVVVTAPSSPVKPERRWLSWMGAAGVIAGLVWFLFFAPQPGSDVAPVDTGRKPQDQVDHLMAELKSPSPLRREIARYALTAYGTSVVERLKKAGVDPEVIDECNGITAKMREVRKKMDAFKIDLNFESNTLTDVVGFLRDFTGLNITCEVKGEALTLSHDFEAKGESLSNILSRLCQTFGIRYYIHEEGMVILTEGDLPVAPCRRPVRVTGNPAKAQGFLEAYRTASGGERDRIAWDLRRMSFASEPVLWKALDSNDEMVRVQSGDLLKQLYSPEGAVCRGLPLRRLQSIKVDADFNKTSLTQCVLFFTDLTGESFLIDTRSIPTPNQETTLWIKGMSIDAILKIILAQEEWVHMTVGEVVVLTSPKHVAISRSPYWTSPEDAVKAEGLMSDLVSSDPGRWRRGEEGLFAIGEPVLGVLEEAAFVHEGEIASRCESLRYRIASAAGKWLASGPSWGRSQVLSEAQKKILDQKVYFDAQGESFEEVLKKSGIPHLLKAGVTEKMYIWSRNLRADFFLQAITRPYGLDFYMDGETVVIDTAENVRAKVGK